MGHRVTEERSALAAHAGVGLCAILRSITQRAGFYRRHQLPHVQTPTLVLAAARLCEEVLGDFRGAAKLFPNGRLVVFPGVTGFVQHLLPVPCARAWLDFASNLQH